MADFVAVIRRTVDGLSDNVPEMRTKVYDKARVAVRRQLEGMKPRPSDDMIDRQMVKLETAIQEVESEHAVALPPVDEPATADLPVYAEPEQSDETGKAEAVEAAPQAEELSFDDTKSGPGENVAESWQQPSEPAQLASDGVAEDNAPAASGEQATLPWNAPEPLVPERDAPEPDHWPPNTSQIFERDAEPHEDVPVPLEAAREVAGPLGLPETTPEPGFEAHRADADDFDAQPIDHADRFALAVDASAPSRDDQGAQLSRPQTPSEWDLPQWNDPAPMPATGHEDMVWSEPAQAAPVPNDLPDLDDDGPATTSELRSATDVAALESTVDPSHSWAWDDSDPFPQAVAPAAPEDAAPAIADWSWPAEKRAAPAQEARGWEEIDDLLNAQAGSNGISDAAAGRSESAAKDMAAPARPASWRAAPKRSIFTLTSISITLVLLLLAGGGGYAYWIHQSRVNAWVVAFVASVTSSAPPLISATPQATPQGASKTPATDTATPAQTPTSQQVAAVEPSTKFTQRLQTDGTELDPGPAPLPTGENPEQEGKSVAAQTEASRPLDAANSATTPQTAQSNPVQQPVIPVPAGQTGDTTAAAQVPAGAQKMFLYEERLGQAAPTAIEGSVAWSIKEEAPQEGAKPEPVVQAQINVPDRGLTALITIKRNVDTSLPASHVIEFVFSLPQNFEGGSIDSVQRVSMKRTEQDRGDALIAVPAKITEDFHMIALNDFPEAVATNTELLRSRSWIDIPLTYRNGRRALLTLEKGTSGTDAFTKALQAWSLAAKPIPAVQ